MTLNDAPRFQPPRFQAFRDEDQIRQDREEELRERMREFAVSMLAQAFRDEEVFAASGPSADDVHEALWDALDEKDVFEKAVLKFREARK